VVALVYLACALTALSCAVLLLRAYRLSGARLLLWSGICFGLLALNSLLILLDLRVFPELDLSVVRNSAALAGVTCLLWGLIWDAR
jgi:hypothetical protein